MTTLGSTDEEPKSDGRATSFVKEFMYNNRNQVAASGAAFVSTLSGFPLDSVKSRLQVRKYASLWDCFVKTYAEEGLPGFFRGVAIPLVTITIVRTISFSIYTGTKSKIEEMRLIVPDTTAKVFAAGFVGGATSGILLSLGTCAFEFTKIKMQLDHLIAMKAGLPYVPKGSIEGFREIVRKGGFRGLYTGFWLHTFRDLLGTGLYYAYYDTATHLLRRHRLTEKMPQTLLTFLSGSMCGVASWAVIYPLDLVKTNYQRNALASLPEESPATIFRRVASGGVSRLYSGLGVSATRSVLTHGLMWTILEHIRNSIESNYKATQTTPIHR